MIITEVFLLNNIPELFGSLVFNETVMKKRLPQDIFIAVKKTIEEGKTLDPKIAGVVANEMKEWAIENDATHFTHWFQPMTGITAEKHDSFISPSENGKVIMEFSGKELIKGEPDASSFPSGGLRATFEARGYTAWDPTSYAFIKDNTLCIPTAFCSYGGQALDKKTPLLRSMSAVNKQTLRFLKALGDTETKAVNTTVGPEQEYFLIDKEMYKQRKDLIFSGRTLFGAMPPKGQEMEDHYFGVIKPRVSAFMKELDEELWKLGVLAKTKHNEAAPAQHELAPVYVTTNIAIDHNQITMELMKKIADKYDLACLLHEKPFEYINGSGKHNNWSISTDLGENLLNPTSTPESNERFLLMLCAVIKGVDEYQDLMRISVASAGNDHRLGGNEAPPAILSIFLGEELESILEAIENGEEYVKKSVDKMKLGAKVIPEFRRDNTDRNRTSPFAFTGNKFEFRMLGSNDSAACPNIMLNTIVAEELSQFTEMLEAGKSPKEIIRETMKNHKRIIFNGNNYSNEWVNEAEQRGLSNFKTTPEALAHYTDEKNVKLFEKHNIYTREELVSRYEILVENYNKVVGIEAKTMLYMVRNDIIPAISEFSNDMCVAVENKRAVSDKINCSVELDLAEKSSCLLAEIYRIADDLDKELKNIYRLSDFADMSFKIKDNLIPVMNSLRKVVDEAEVIVGGQYWPYPTYADMLFYI